MRNNAAHGGDRPAFAQQAAINMVKWYAQHMPQELPMLVAKLERQPVGLGAEETEAGTQSWWDRAVTAVVDLGAQAVSVVGGYKLQAYQDKRAEELAKAQWETELADQKRQAEVYAIQAQTLEQKKLAQAQLNAINQAETRAAWGPYVMPISIGVGLLALWMVFRK